MNTLTLDQLIADATRLKAQFGGHCPTSILELKSVPRMIAAFDSETEGLAQQVRIAEEEEARLDKEHREEILELEKQNRELEASLGSLKSLLSEKEDGKTIMDWKREAEEAKAEAQQARMTVADWSREVKAMRKRKGVQAGLFRHGGAVMVFLQDLIDSPGLSVDRSHIAELLSKIRNTK